MVSVFELFKIGIGPSSSHTVGPMVAAKRFRDELEDVRGAKLGRITVELFGSLAWTGKGHRTDVALCLGLSGETPATVDPDAAEAIVQGVRSRKAIRLTDGSEWRFDPETDIIFNFVDLLSRHCNGMRFRALRDDGATLLERTYYSVGGGFIVGGNEPDGGVRIEAPLPFGSASELLRICDERALTIAGIQMANELAYRCRGDVERGVDGIRDAMFACIDRGLRVEGELPGGLRVRRRAKALFEKLNAARLRNQHPPHEILDWVSTFAIAVNEENASGGRVVTAPTNGAAGVVPAVLRYFRDFCPEYTDEQSRVFLLTAAAIGGLIKQNASISGAEVGCQGEVGSAASMAAAGLAAALGATPRQIENAAEIAMEHHLGMTCDPIGGLVQIPCIERNAFGANKAIAAASLAMRGDGTHRVSLDAVIETMRQTGADMQAKYKETSQGGLAVNVAAC
jgi:L-serine dehydratase